ncbi:MAG: Bax inhibitor-1/YccA family protein, partial [Armatimonadota bacterium]
LYMMIGLIGGLITSLVIIFVKTTAPYLSPVYALLEGLAIGGISAFANASYPGLVLPAVMLTFATLGALLFLYQTRIIRATDKFKMGVVGATGAIFLVYMLTFVLGLFKIQIPLIHSSGLIGIGFSLFVVGIAALTLVLDFDFIENGAAQNAPKYMEWYGAFGLIVTLIWLYLEILRLLMKLQDRRR